MVNNMKIRIIIVLLLLLTAPLSAGIFEGPNLALEADMERAYKKGIEAGELLNYGPWVQTLNTEGGKIEIHFNDVKDTWRQYVEPFTELSFPSVMPVYPIYVDLTDKMQVIELKLPSARYKIALIFVDVNKPYTHTRGYMRIVCGRPVDIMKVYFIAKPAFKEYYYKETFRFPKNFIVDLRNDIFLNSGQSLEKFKERRKTDYIRSLKPLPKSIEQRMGKDENNDCIIDDYQMTILHREQQDKNRDEINDAYQTMTFYTHEKMTTFFDIDGDGLCDNYAKKIFNCSTKTADYSDMEIDLRNDIFQSKNKSDSVKLIYIDENSDGINDVFQDSKYSAEAFTMGYPLKVTSFKDVNGDTINDIFQTTHIYHVYNMKTFIDLDGDGLSDTYKKK